MKITRIGTLCLMLALGAASAAGAQPPPDVHAVGPRVGAVVPSFSLPDQTGVARNLDSLMGPAGLMLVFSRSADW